MPGPVEAPVSRTSSLVSVDDILRERARDEPQTPFIAFPKSLTGLNDFELFSARDINFFVNNAVKVLLDKGLNTANGATVALLGLSTLDYTVTMLALSRMGYGLLILSPRLSIEAYISLLEKAECRMIVFARTFSTVVEKIWRLRHVESHETISRPFYDLEHEPLGLEDNYDSLSYSTIAYILHSSGSTGIPKPIFQTHQSCLATFSHGNRSRGVSALPLYHTFGHASFYRTLFHRGTIYMYNANLPFTSDNLSSVLEYVQPEAMFGVPYLLKLLAESQRGIAALRDLKVVASSGSAIPDEIGNLLAQNDVNLVTFFGSTETGQLMNSMRPKSDKAWDYLRIIPTAKPYIRMIPIPGGTYELVVLDGLKSKVISNSNDPPNSFHSRDLFTPHATIPDAWKYLGRLDDRVTLVNGEKVLPLPIEGRIRQDPSVKEAVVFGIGRDGPGLLAFRSLKAQYLSDESFISAIWPAVEDANSKAESFSQISRQSIIPMSAEAEYPRTDKGTVIRAQVYRVFAEEIDRLYEKLQGNREGTLKLTEEQLQSFLITTFKHGLGIELESPEADFFSSGLDSLKAINLASEIKKELYLGGQPEKVNQNTVYANQNVVQLARFLYELQTGQESTENGMEELNLMTTLINENAIFAKHTPGNMPNSQDQLVLLTGVTGSLGAHILAQLIPFPQIKSIHCLIRPHPKQSLFTRLLSSLRSREIAIDSSALEEKVTCIPIDPAASTLGCPPSIISSLRTHHTTIIHAAWHVNFTLSLASFTQNITTTKTLIDLALSSQTHQPMRFVFCSSVSAGLASPPGSLVPETPLSVGTLALPQGYARSKFVTEHIANNAARSTASFDVRVLRIGQIAGDMEQGVWNDTEAIPLMIRSATTIGLLPELDEMCSWLPVNRCASAVVELGGLGATERGDGATAMVDPPTAGEEEEEQGGARFYNVLHPRPFHWTHDLLPTLRASRHLPPFDTVPVGQWLKVLGSSSSEQDPAKNPSVKLLGFWKAKYSSRGGDAEDGDADGNGRVKYFGEKVGFNMERAMRESTCLRDIGGFLGEGVMERVVERWMGRWGSAAGTDCGGGALRKGCK